MPAARSTPARPTALQVDLARRLAHAIHTGRFQAGDHLSEEPLAEEFSVSRTPVRGALRLLAEQGLIVYRPNSGYRVQALPEGAEPPAIQSPEPTQDELYRKLIDDRAARLLPKTFTERDLSERYGAARSVLTKTLVQLSGDGLIEKRKGHGWQFAPTLTGAALAESYRFRMTVECAGLLEPTFQADADALAVMRRAHEALLHSPNDQISAQDFFTLNASFHEMLARFSGNRYILQAVQQQNQLRRLEEHAHFHRHSRYAKSTQDHLEIIAAIEAGDREWASQLMRQHLKTALQVS